MRRHGSWDMGRKSLPSSMSARSGTSPPRYCASADGMSRTRPPRSSATSYPTQTASWMPSHGCSSTDPMLTVRDFLMPDLGEGLTEGEINRWLVAEGDVVVVDQPIAEITTEKAVVEVPTPFAGRVAALHGAAGEAISVGKPLISIEVAAAPAEGASGNVLVGYGTSESAPRARRSLTPASSTAGAARSAASD